MGINPGLTQLPKTSLKRGRRRRKSRGFFSHISTVLHCWFRQATEWFSESTSGTRARGPWSIAGPATKGSPRRTSKNHQSKMQEYHQVEICRTLWKNHKQKHPNTHIISVVCILHWCLLTCADAGTVGDDILLHSWRNASQAMGAHSLGVRAPLSKEMKQKTVIDSYD